ncbi:RimK-like ATPgrasp N-terminal domain-containing protein [Oleiphilus messinensis]|uniref:RimK-like ATPgrasp N-terminal domain-containing protein n=1 Tax=Oleiphilus messinensis TaxID=141451 RepID=UPI000B3B845B|nr:RimK-like ATPgrasp N-terminal domain-containing protein [Oleiphilus messinensis]
MSQVYIVVDRPSDWAPYYPSDRVITFEQYLSLEPGKQRVRVINLCENYSYLQPGYYCSLLAEAREHHVIPSIRVLSDLSHPVLAQIQLSKLSPALDKLLKSRDAKEEISIKSYS